MSIVVDDFSLIQREKGSLSFLSALIWIASSARTVAIMASSSVPTTSNKSAGGPALPVEESHELGSSLSEVTSTISAVNQQAAAESHTPEAPTEQTMADSAPAQNRTTSGPMPAKSPFWRLWMIEIVSMITSLLLLAVIVAVLAAFDGVTQPDWGGRITLTLNSPIAIFATLMLIVTEGNFHLVQDKF